MVDHGVLAVEMEASALYTLAASYGRKALAICTSATTSSPARRPPRPSGSRPSARWSRSPWRRRSDALPSASGAPGRSSGTRGADADEPRAAWDADAVVGRDARAAPLGRGAPRGHRMTWPGSTSRLHSPQARRALVSAWPTVSKSWFRTSPFSSRPSYGDDQAERVQVPIFTGPPSEWPVPERLELRRGLGRAGESVAGQESLRPTSSIGRGDRVDPDTQRSPFSSISTTLWLSVLVT